jgi:hypothetical protein
MKKKLNISLLILFASVCAAIAQESPTTTPAPTPEESPIVSPTPEEFPSPSPTPEESATPSPTPEQTPSASSARNVRISFIPPPLEGTISLGIYDRNGKLVRVLHQQAELNKFTIGADALETQWDGKKDDGEDLPAGKYHARGYLVGNLQAEPIGNSTPADDAIPTSDIQIRLMSNPLAKNRRQIVNLGVGFDDENSFLKTADGLPLFTVDKKPNLTRALVKKSGEKSLDVWEEDGGPAMQFRISNVDKMMAFDCGDFELK